MRNLYLYLKLEEKYVFFFKDQYEFVYKTVAQVLGLRSYPVEKDKVTKELKKMKKDDDKLIHKTFGVRFFTLKAKDILISFCFTEYDNAGILWVAKHGICLLTEMVKCNIPSLKYVTR